MAATTRFGLKRKRAGVESTETPTTSPSQSVQQAPSASNTRAVHDLIADLPSGALRNVLDAVADGSTLETALLSQVKETLPDLLKSKLVLLRNRAAKSKLETVAESHYTSTVNALSWRGALIGRLSGIVPTAARDSCFALVAMAGHLAECYDEKVTPFGRPTTLDPELGPSAHIDRRLKRAVDMWRNIVVSGDRDSINVADELDDVLDALRTIRQQLKPLIPRPPSSLHARPDQPTKPYPLAMTALTSFSTLMHDEADAKRKEKIKRWASDVIPGTPCNKRRRKDGTSESEEGQMDGSATSPRGDLDTSDESSSESDSASDDDE